MERNELQSLQELKEEEKIKILDRASNGILEKENADFLIKLIDNAENKTEVLKISALGMTYKRTGFHFDVRLEKNEGQTIRYLKKNENLSFDQGGITHKLIIGDNYPALLNLLISYKNKIKVIYIDPPYGKDDLGAFAQTNYNNAITRDNLLSMLYPRLILARQLLKDDGVIFCSIDDRNQAYVKCLFDEVFGEGNFVETFIWNKTETPPSLSCKTRKTHEYVLCYQKNINNDKMIAKYISGGDAPLYNESNSVIELNFLANYVDTNLKDGVYLKGKRDKIELLDDVLVQNGKIVNNFRLQGNFRWTQEFLDKEVKDGTKLIVKGDKFAIRYCRDGSRSVTPTNYISNKILYEISKEISKKDNVGTNETATSELKEIFQNKIFNYNKPLSLIQYLCKIINDNESIILDFFAGSGTTGHAVLELNKQDGGNRQFILVTNNEITDLNPNGIALDVTSKRLKRIMSGECYDESKDFKWLEKNTPYGDSLEVSEIENIASSDHSVFEKIDEKLYGKDFENIHDKIEWICKEFELTCRKIEGE
ncbi:site-specific DNA-methyltransferase [Campylobacter sp. LMG 7929]|uniref:site-specific DNA-methyltransferase n=1 Tax=Campylobacter sp. LMG 7929 TaxID=2735749 RepID=UPI00301BD389